MEIRVENSSDSESHKLLLPGATLVHNIFVEAIEFPCLPLRQVDQSKIQIVLQAQQLVEELEPEADQADPQVACGQ